MTQRPGCRRCPSHSISRAAGSTGQQQTVIHVSLIDYLPRQAGPCPISNSKTPHSEGLGHGTMCEDLLLPSQGLGLLPDSVVGDIVDVVNETIVVRAGSSLPGV